MDAQSGETFGTAGQPPKQQESPWVWILMALGILIICVLVIVLVALLNPDALKRLSALGSRVDVTAGTYDGATYTAPHDNFTCDFSTLMESLDNPYLVDGKDEEEGTGVVFFTENDGTQYGIDYVRINKVGAAFERAIKDPRSRNEVYHGILDEVVMPTHSESASVVHTEIVSHGSLFAIILNPDGITNGTPQPALAQGLDEGYYIFNREEWVYIVYALIPPAHAPDEIDQAAMKDELDKVYNHCQFVR